MSQKVSTFRHRAVIIIDRPKEVECNDPCDGMGFVGVVGRRRGLEVDKGRKGERGESADGYFVRSGVLDYFGAEVGGFVGWIWLDITS